MVADQHWLCHYLNNVNKLINDLDEELKARYAPYYESFKLMEELALILKKRRLSNIFL